MSELRLGAPETATVIIRDAKHPDGDEHGFADLVVEIRAPGLEATTWVRSLQGASDLAGFLEGVAREWRGWEGERTWDSLEHDLSVVATHDGWGHVILRFTLRESYRPEAWTASVSIKIEAGEELSRIVRDARDFLTK